MNIFNLPTVCTAEIISQLRKKEVKQFPLICKSANNSHLWNDLIPKGILRIKEMDGTCKIIFCQQVQSEDSFIKLIETLKGNLEDGTTIFVDLFRISPVKKLLISHRFQIITPTDSLESIVIKLFPSSNKSSKYCNTFSKVRTADCIKTLFKSMEIINKKKVNNMAAREIISLRNFCRNVSPQTYCQLSIESKYLIAGRYYYNDSGWSFTPKFDLIRNFENELKIQNSNWEGADYAIKEAMLFKIHILIASRLIKFCENNDYRTSPDPMNGVGKEIIQSISKGVDYNILTRHLERRLSSIERANTAYYKPVLPTSYIRNSSSIFPFPIRQKIEIKQENSTQELPIEDLDLLITFSKNPSWREFCKLPIESQYLIAGRYYYNDSGWFFKKKFDLIQQFESEFTKKNSSWSADNTGHDAPHAIEEAIQIKIQIQETISYIRAMEAVKNNQKNSGTEELRIKLLDKLRIELSQLYDAYPPLNTYSEEKPLKEEFLFEVSPQEDDLNSDDDSCCTLYCTII